jgi:hypothetical protein
MSFGKAVAAKIAAQRGHEEAAMLWKKLWGAYERRGAEGVQRLLDDLLKAPEGADEASER